MFDVSITSNMQSDVLLRAVQNEMHALRESISKCHGSDFWTLGVSEMAREQLNALDEIRNQLERGC